MRTLETEDGGEEQGKKDQIIPHTKSESSAAEAISNQSEMIEEILSRLPVKTLLESRCVSKPWRNLISDPSFVKLHGDRTTHHGLVISAYNLSNFERYFLFVGHNGGSITQILTIPDSDTNSESSSTRSQHVNGLLLLCSVIRWDVDYLAIVYNPSTRKIFKVPSGDGLPDVNIRNYYSLGFNESSREHMILNIKRMGIESDESDDGFQCTGVEIEIFSLSTYSWRKIDVDFPIDPGVEECFFWNRGKSVCVNSVIYIMPPHGGTCMLTFDLISETFSSMNSPTDCAFLMKICGFLGLSNLDVNVDGYKMEFWMLEDYKNQVWVKDTITPPDCWISKYNIPYPIDCIQSCKIVFTPHRISTDVLSIPIYDMKKGSFTAVEVNLTHELLSSETLGVDTYCVSSYVESMIPLKNSTELVPFISGKGNDQNGTTNS